MTAWKNGKEYSSYPDYEVTLKPPVFKLRSGEDLDEFFASASELRTRVDKVISSQD